MPRIPESWTLFEDIPSAMDTIHDAATRGAPEGTVHIARRQTEGRGRMGRIWWSPPGLGLWMAVLLRPRLPRQKAPGLSLLAGRAVKEALQPLLSLPLSLYWPNDLFVSGKKLGGILAETRSQEDVYWIALGVGINIDFKSERVPESVAGVAISLADAGSSEKDPVTLARRIVNAFWPLYSRYQADENLQDLVGNELAHTGRPVTVRPPTGTEWQGIVRGLGPDGELLVQDRKGSVRAVLTADISYDD